MSVIEAPVVFRDRNAILRLDRAAKVVSILSGADRTGKNDVVFRSNVGSVINVETSEERLGRQHARARELSNNATLKAGESGAMAAGAQTEDDVGCFSRGGSNKRSAAGGAFMSPSSGSEQSTMPAAVVAPQPFFLHCVVNQKKIHSITFFSRSGEEQLTLVKLAVAAILEEVYIGGQKHMVAFVSPVSGSGGAKKMWEREVLPILYLSKHTVLVITTTHQAHCEEYVADLANPLNGNHVVVAIGGDGMMHEAVNGLQKRREVLQQRGVDEEAEGIPLLATVPAGSGCALAKCFNIIEPIEAALALVHLNTTTIDLMHIAYVPCMHTFVPTAEEIKEAKKKKLPIPVVRKEMTNCTQPPRYAFLNVAFAITNEVDKGSEQWRWMGNARFTVKALQLVAAGIPLYRCRVRYRPWANAVTGERLEKTAVHHHLPKKTFPKCTGRDGCGHCQQHRVLKRDRNDQPVENPVEEDWIDLPQDRFALLMVNNLVDAARDMAMAPLAHVGDGSMDIVYNGRLPTEPDAITRTEFIKVFLGLEAGVHIDEPNVHYVKVKEVEILAEDGLVMADGELLPTSGVRVRNLPQALRVVRSL